MYRGKLTPRKVAVLTLNLPRGAVTWQLTGGPGAITEEVEALWGVHLLQQYQMYQAAGGKGEKPKFQEYPTGYEEKETSTDRIEANARAFREKFGKKSA